jgi:uncharacterized protein (UPF0147 family)
MANRIPCRRLRRGAAAALVLGVTAAPPAAGDGAAPPQSAAAPFTAHVDMPTFMEHVLTPAARTIWSANAAVIDAGGEHDLSPRTDDDWENIESGAATLAEATNALMIPERVRDAAWNRYVRKLADAADRAVRATAARDIKSLSEVSDALDGVCASCHRHYGVE